MRKTRWLFFKIGGILLLLGTALLLLLPSHNEVDTNTKIMISERLIRSAINQGECRLPDLPIDNPEIMKFYTTAVERIDCGNELEDWVMCEKSICFVKPEISASHGEVSCSYTDFIRNTDEDVSYGKTTKTKEPYVLQESDFAKVACRSESGQRWYGNVYGIRDSVKRSIPAPKNYFGSLYSVHEQDTAPKHFNVLMFGFDSLSRNAFIRKLPKSYAYLTQKLQSVVLKGYNIVGDGTPQALIPLLTGYTELELPETRKRMHNSHNVDVYPLIWRDYAQHGYYTSFNEDMPDYGTFTYRLNGFNKQPVDHYLRTYYLQKTENWSWSKEHCIGHTPDHVVMLNYTKDFMTKYRGSPRFVFSFHGGLSHDSINLIGTADDDVVNWLRSLKEERLLDDTILIFMADHGNRFSDVRATLQGKQEERMPFFSFAFPETFKKKFPQKYENFVQNADVLTTPFDVHATLKDILTIQTEDENDRYDEAAVADLVNNAQKNVDTPIIPTHISELAQNRAISLFNPIPKRSCASAYIEPHWCACLNWQKLDLNNLEYTAILHKASSSIIELLNNATSAYRSICAQLELQKINWAMRLRPHAELLHYKSSSDRDGFLPDMTDDTRQHEAVYQLQIIVDPGASLFEASVSIDLRNYGTRAKLSDVSRINKYGEQANCIYQQNPELRKFCYCNNRS